MIKRDWSTSSIRIQTRESTSPSLRVGVANTRSSYGGYPGALRASNNRPDARPTYPPAPNFVTRSARIIPVVTVRSCREAVLSYSATSSGKCRRTSAIRARSFSVPCSSRSRVTPPGVIRSIISRCPKHESAHLRTRSRSAAQWVSIKGNAASLQIAPMSPK